MRDLLPEEARTLSSLGRRLIDSFELSGYERVILPVFEYADVLERGLGSLDPREVLRFVEPETGEVVALRPDLTPQIARLVATRLAEAPEPIRLCYEGSIVRLRRERARRNRQIPQAGIELVGSPAPAGDLEVLAVASVAVRSAGLASFVLDLGHAKIAGSLLERVGTSERARAVEALRVKDARELERAARAGGLEPELVSALVSLTELAGGEEIWSIAETRLAGTPAQAALVELRRVFDAAAEASFAPALSVDLGEVRDLAYYTGVTFQVLATGPGEPVGSGGRYDRLLEKFGTARPAAGFAVALDHLNWALGRASVGARFRALIASQGVDPGPALVRLRAAGIACTAFSGSDPLGYARAWRYACVIELGPSGATLHELDATHRESEILALLEAKSVSMGQP